MSSGCNCTQERLYGRLDLYTAMLSDDGVPTAKATLIFNQTFVAGTEGKPQCNLCNKYIGEHDSGDENDIALLDPGLTKAPTLKSSQKNLYNHTSCCCGAKARKDLISMAHVVDAEVLREQFLRG